MTATTRSRPRSLPSTTTKLETEMGNLYVTVSTDEEGEPFEVFGTGSAKPRSASSDGRDGAGLPVDLAAPA